MLKTVISRVRSEGLQTSYGLGNCVCCPSVRYSFSQSRARDDEKKTLFTTFCHSDRFNCNLFNWSFSCLFVYFSPFLPVMLRAWILFRNYFHLHGFYLLKLNSCGSWVRSGICLNSVLKSFLLGILIAPKHRLNCFFPLFLLLTPPSVVVVVSLSPSLSLISLFCLFFALS
jgi:hypothetical protein